MSEQSHFFIVLEGLDGSGKSEISRRLYERMSGALGERVMLTYEPHDPSAAGEYIRQILRKEIAVSPWTLALGFALNRADHNERVITPFLTAGDRRVVICDRYLLSSLVYQSTGGLSVDDVLALNAGARRPDLTLFLDARPETCYARMDARRGDRQLFEERLAETRDKYFAVIRLLQARGEPVQVLDANGSIGAVLGAVIEAVNQSAPSWLRVEQTPEDTIL